jgi:hypothetical protein
MLFSCQIVLYGNEGRLFERGHDVSIEGAGKIRKSKDTAGQRSHQPAVSKNLTS